jgi:L-aspartate oxidase
VAPAQHYHSGGILVDEVGRSSLPGLYAVGETSCTGVHGANRLASNSLLEGLVFAHRIGDELSARLADGDLPVAEPTPAPGEPTLLPATDRRAVQRATTEGPGVIRSSEGMAAAATALARLPEEAHRRGRAPTPSTAEWETTNLHHVATALTQAALIREETRGGHYREDFPKSDGCWRGRLVSRLGPGGYLQTRFHRLEEGL